MIFDIQIFIFRGHLCKNCSEFEKVKRKDATYANLTDRRHVKSLKLKSQISRIKKNNLSFIFVWIDVVWFAFAKYFKTLF